jgi:uncharacterized protein (TIGR03086 family)
MSEISEHFAQVAGQFTQRARAVPDAAWDNPAPCEGWVARDVVRHMVDWMPGLFFDPWDIERPPLPSVDVDPAGAWSMLVDTIQSKLEDPEAAKREADIRPGHFSFEQAIDMFGTGDIVIHIWDLARATGLDETLDPGDVHRMLTAMEPMDEALRASGHYGPRVIVPDGADEQTKLIAFTGRKP